MPSASEWITRLRTWEAPRWPEMIDAQSGLPGPRANLALVEAVAQMADTSTVDALLSYGSEYTAMCAAAALGRAAGSPGGAERARSSATDSRWRVREGDVIGLQLWADAEPEPMRRLMARWVDDADPLVQRAAVAAGCEPRLLRTPEAAAAALALCARATDALARADAAQRRSAPFRTLRQTLGYAWSVAIAADPAPGLAAFRALADVDPDVAWIVRENRRKKRLATLL